MHARAVRGLTSDPMPLVSPDPPSHSLCASPVNGSKLGVLGVLGVFLCLVYVSLTPAACVFFFPLRTQPGAGSDGRGVASSG